MSFVFKVNGTDIPTPSEFGWSIQDVSAPDSGRTLDGLMQKERVIRKEKIALKWLAKDPTVTATI